MLAGIQERVHPIFQGVARFFENGSRNVYGFIDWGDGDKYERVAQRLSPSDALKLLSSAPGWSLI